MICDGEPSPVRRWTSIGAAAVCTPSRSGFLAGRHPQRNGTYEMIRNDTEVAARYTPRSSRQQNQ